MDKLVDRQTYWTSSPTGCVAYWTNICVIYKQTDRSGNKIYKIRVRKY